VSLENESVCESGFGKSYGAVTQARKITQNERDYKETKSGMRHTARNYGNNSCGSHHKAKTRTFLHVEQNKKNI
jgi:hypothetical protein